MKCRKLETPINGKKLMMKMQIPMVEDYLFGFEMQIAYSNGRGGIVSGKTVTWTGIPSPNKSTSGWGTLEIR
jgi:hypothetical protein